MSASEHMEKVASCPCLICLYRLGRKTFGCEVHHVGDAEDRDDFAVASLCPEHHRGPTGVHGLHRRAFRTMWKVSDIQLLAWQNQALQRFA